MPFTFAQNNEDNTMETYDLSISINPDAAIINQVLEVGTVVAGLVSVANTGVTNADVYLSADWGPSAGTTDLDATLLANALNVTVFTEGVQTFDGRFMDLINQPVITGLTALTGEAGVAISITMPDDRTGPTLLGKAIHTDFVFVAVSVA